MFRLIAGRSARAAPARARGSGPRAEPVRGRKSRADPVAKSKEERIKAPPAVDPAEMVVLRERFSEYQLAVRALRLEFKEEMLRKRYEEETGSLAEERTRQEAEEHRGLMAWNLQENVRLLTLRKQRVQAEQEERERERAQAAARRDQQQQEFIRAKEVEILQLQEEAKTFITSENLDQRIEAALDNPKNYNFAIDKEGRVVKQTVLE